jgi:hypothetical protein
MYHGGWIGLKSVPRTSAWGYSLEIVRYGMWWRRECVLGEVHSPDTCSRAEIENSLDFIADGREEKIAAEDETVDVMT